MRESLFKLAYSFERRDLSTYEGIKENIPKPIDETAFVKLTKLGNGIDTNNKFQEALTLTIHKIIELYNDNGKNINIQTTLVSIIDGLKNMKSPSFVGEFVKFFLKADELSQMYIISKIIEIKYISAENSLNNKLTYLYTLKDLKENLHQYEGDSDTPLYIIRNFMEEGLLLIQEKAMFEFHKPGIENRRPNLPINVHTKNMALKFIERNKYGNPHEDDLSHAVQFLVNYPYRDNNIDAALSKILKSNLNSLNYNINTFNIWGIRLVRLELDILERNAKGLSDLELSLAYTTRFLSDKTDDLSYLQDLITFHSKFNINNFPLLSQITKDYFARFPELPNELGFDSSILNQFKTDVMSSN